MALRFGTRRAQAKDETRRMILKSAQDLFTKMGYEKATMRTLAARAGVGLGTIFKHFSSKPALLVATFDEDMRPVVEKAWSSIPATTLKAQLIHLIEQVFTYYAHRSQLAKVLLREVIFMEGDGADSIKALERQYQEVLAALFQQAVDRGELRPDTDIPLAVTAFWSYYTHTVLAGLNAPHFDIDAQLNLLERLIDQLLSGIAAPIP